MKKLLIISCILSFGLICNTFSANTAKTISITVKLDKSITQSFRVFGTGFSVNNTSKGSIGSSARKTGPANAKYSFGFKTVGKGVGCGSAVLRRDSLVILKYKRGRCIHVVTPK